MGYAIIVLSCTRKACGSCVRVPYRATELPVEGEYVDVRRSEPYVIVDKFDTWGQADDVAAMLNSLVRS